MLGKGWNLPAGQLNTVGEQQLNRTDAVGEQQLKWTQLGCSSRRNRGVLDQQLKQMQLGAAAQKRMQSGVSS